jgi:mRNA-degrading endonuclease RelE of RelBE toxin-antitoxin system
MEFRISDTFTDSLTKLTGDEQKAVKTTAFDLQLNPANPGMQFHRIDKARDPNFWSVRVNSDLRLIIHKTDGSLLLCYVDHHDDAYKWSYRRKIEKHPKTGAAQLVEIRETFKEVIVPKYVDGDSIPAELPKLFAQIPADDLLGYGVPPEWLADVLEATEDSLFGLSEHLPTEAAEALLDLATGTKPVAAAAVDMVDVDPFAHPDAQRRFRLVTNVEELERALDFPWEKWTVFLHPAQRKLVERSFNGPARVSGSAGTGKTIVALHRAVHLARQNPGSRVLLATFSPSLAMALTARMKQLIGNEPKIAGRIEISTITDVAKKLYGQLKSKQSIADPEAIQGLLTNAAAEVDGHHFTDKFLWAEWNDIIDAWHLASWDEYKDVQRLGRKTRLRKEQRETAWKIFERVINELKRQNLITSAGVLYEVRMALVSSSDLSDYDFAVIDEAQDISVPELRFVAALGASRPDSLFFSGDLGQRIFQSPFSWKSLGVDIRGRSHTLRINYRTSQQIRSQADRLLPPELSDVDGIAENRKGTISVFQGPAPDIRECEDRSIETTEVCNWLKARAAEGFQPREIGVFVRSENEFDRAEEAIHAAGMKSARLVDNLEPDVECVSVSTMHLAKGLEFRAVVVMACDDDVIPLQERIESVADDSDLEEVYNTERHLLYVACTRARDQLLVTGVHPMSEFLSDLLG